MTKSANAKKEVALLNATSDERYRSLKIGQVNNLS